MFDLPFTPTRPLEVDPSSLVQLSFPILSQTSGDGDKQTVADSVSGSVAVITLNAPEKLNALTYDDMQTLFTLMDWIDEQSAVQVTVLTGRGRFFSAGANFADPARSKTPPEWTEYSPEHVNYQSSVRSWNVGRLTNTNAMAFQAFYRHSKLLVAAMNGPVVGISAAMVAFCDLIYTYDNFYLLTPFSQLALVAESGSSKTFAAKMGLGRAQQALIEGRKMTSKELSEAGFISHIFPTPASSAGATSDKQFTLPILDDVLAHIANRLLAPHVDSFAVHYTKRLLREAAYEAKSIVAINADEVRGGQITFGAGRPQRQFARLASGGRHKL